MDAIMSMLTDNFGPFGPLLAVGPDQLHWQLPAGATATEQATLDISNIGTGNLTWTAAEDADWLSLDATAGTTPGALTVTVDPAQAPADTPLSTVITISGDNGQTLQLPVSLLVGVSPVWAVEVAPPVETQEVFLPLVVR